MYLSDDVKVFNVKDIWQYSKDHNVKMLSEYPADFWAGYRANYQRFDRYFMKLFTSWFPIEQDYSEGVESIQQDFAYDVYAHLMANDKRYSELYRVNVIQDDAAYSLTNNVDYTETTQRISNRDIEFNKGSETDTETNSRTKGQEVDSESNSRVKGSETDSESNSRTYGSHTDTESNSIAYGAHVTDTTKSTSAYNATTYQATDKESVDDGTHTDTENKSRTEAEKTDTETLSRTEGQRTDTETLSRTEGQRQDSESLSRTEGIRKDTTDDDTTEDITTHKVGNMGVQTVDDMLKKHWDNWTLFDFYGIIFQDIATMLLRGC